MTKKSFEVVATNSAAMPQGHYSQAVIHNETVYVAMQIAIDPEKGPVKGTSAEQARVALLNVKEILRAAGSDLDRVLRVTVYVSDIEYWGEVNEVYSEMFGKHKPARGVVPVKDMHLGLSVGFEVTAALLV